MLAGPLLVLGGLILTYEGVKDIRKANSKKSYFKSALVLFTGLLLLTLLTIDVLALG